MVKMNLYSLSQHERLGLSFVNKTDRNITPNMSILSDCHTSLIYIRAFHISSFCLLLNLSLKFLLNFLLYFPAHVINFLVFFFFFLFFFLPLLLLLLPISNVSYICLIFFSSIVICVFAFL